MRRHKEQVRLSLYMAIKRRGEKLPYLLSRYAKTDPSVPQSMDNYFDNDNFVPQHLIGLLK